MNVSAWGDRVRTPPSRDVGAHIEKVEPQPAYKGATGFDIVGLTEAASRGLLATLNRGTVKFN